MRAVNATQLEELCDEDEDEFRTDRAGSAASGRRAVVVNLANWDDRTKKKGLQLHAPEVTELVIDLEVDLPIE